MPNNTSFTNNKLLRKHRPTTEKIHAPYRGVTSREDFINITMGMSHDLYYVQRIGGEKEGERGQVQNEEDNFDLVLFGEGTKATTNIGTAGHYCSLAGFAGISQNILDSVWTTSNGVVKTSVDDGIQVSSDGNLDPAFISQSVTVKPGDILYIRLKLKKIKGNCDAVKFGVDDINRTGPDLRTVVFPSSDFVYVDHKIYCTENQKINLRIYPHYQPKNLEATTIQIQEVLIKNLEETSVSLPGLNVGIKSKIDSLEESTTFLKSSIKGGK